MKKVLSVILIFLLLFTIDLDLIWFSIMQFNIKRDVRIEIKKGIKEENLSLFVISLKDNHKLRWIKTDHEFRYKGEMYDVVKVKIKNQKKYIYCLNDIKEKRLITSFLKNHNAKKKSGRNSKRHHSIIKYINYCDSFKIDLNTKDFTNKFWRFIYNSNIVQTTSPPPKIA